MPKKIKIVLKERFEAKFVKTDGCWLWTASLNRKGYGQFRFGHMMNAHRAAWKLYVGPVPNGIYVLHTCDVRRCVNLEHLFLGTQVDNMRDMVQKNRQCKGEDRSIKLTEMKVKEIKQKLKTGFTHRDLAKIYNVSMCTIYSIKHNITWKHV